MSTDEQRQAFLNNVDKKLEELDAFLKEVEQRRKALAEQRAEIGISPSEVKRLLAKIPAAHRKAAVEQVMEELGLDLDREYMNFKDDAKSLSTPIKNQPEKLKKSLKMFNRRNFSV